MKHSCFRLGFWVTILLSVTTLSVMPALIPRSAAQESVQIVAQVIAVVEDQVISSWDVAARLQLILLTTGIPDTQENRQWLTPQILQGLINETVQIREAQRLQLTVSEEEINTYLTNLARLNAMTFDEFHRNFDTMGIPLRTLSHQIRAGLSWRKILTTRVHPQIQITQEEIDARLEQLRGYMDKPRYLVSMISLHLNEANRLEDLQQLAENLVQDLRGGADFAEVARQFSDAAGVIQSGGDLGWIHQGQLDHLLDTTLNVMQPGSISDPIQTSEGVYILFLRERGMGLASDTEEQLIHVQQISWERHSQEQTNILMTQARQFSQEATGCNTLADQVRNSVDATLQDLGQRRLGDLPPQLGEVLRPLAVDQASAPIVTSDQVIVFMVCAKSDTSSTLPERDDILTTIGNERIDMLQRRYLQQLRRAAFIDIR